MKSTTKKSTKNTTKQRRLPIHFRHMFGIPLCSQSPSPATENPLDTTCWDCREQLRKSGIKTTKTHFRANLFGGVLCKIDNDKKRVAEIDATSNPFAVNCGNCKRILRGRGALGPQVVDVTPSAARSASSGGA